MTEQVKEVVAEEKVKFEYTVEECDAILKTLSELPYSKVAGIVENFIAQGREQADAIVAKRAEAAKKEQEAGV